uniref:Serine/threonine-protein kinase n=1 Tax=Gadus morhua TaxID=8049 RepID=A0A8C4YYM6_GADMO
VLLAIYGSEYEGLNGGMDGLIDSITVSVVSADFDALYEELQQLGEGGFGSVFAGYRKEDRLPVRVTPQSHTLWKHIRVSLMLRAAEDRPDPGGPGTVVLLLDWFQLDQELILVQERPSACVDLLSYMESKGGRLQEQDAKMILHQVVEGIQGLHSRGVLHRDIKPENLLVETGSGTPRVRVIDLGCGCHHNSGVYSEFSGTASYIPPEWFTLQSYRADPMTVWQLGVLLYELLTGDVPFQTSGQIIWKMVPCIKSKISPNCKDFLKRCLNKRAGGRLALGSLLHHPWLL